MTTTTAEKPSRAPRTQARRRKDTTNALMKAVIRLLIDRGYAALTMAEVADAAGVSRGALNHYYPTKETLVIAAARFAMEAEMRKIEKAAPGPMDRASAIDAFFAASERFFLSSGFIAQIELVFAARHDQRVGDEYFPLIAEYRELFDATWHRALVRSGMAEGDAASLVDMTNFMMRGMGLGVAHAPRRAGIEAKLADMRDRLRQLFG